MQNSRQKKKRKERRKGRNLPLFDTARKNELKNLQKTTVIYSLKEFVHTAEKNFIPTAQSKNSAVRNVQTRRRLNGLQKIGMKKKAIIPLSRKNVFCAVKSSGRATERSFFAHRNVKRNTTEKSSVLIITRTKNREIKNHLRRF